MKNGLTPHKIQTRILFDNLFNVITKFNRRTGHTTTTIEEVLRDPKKIYIVPSVIMKQWIIKKYNLSKDRVRVIPIDDRGLVELNRMDINNIIFDHYWVELFTHKRLMGIMNELSEFGVI